MSALAAERVKRTHVPFHFSPLNSRERRILHAALRDEIAVRSESNRHGSHPADSSGALGSKDAAGARDPSASALRTWGTRPW
jgi:hypothetical protein